MQIWIKIKVRIMLDNENFNAMLRIALEGSNEGVDDIISDVVPLWKNGTNYLFSMLIPLLIWISKYTECE